MPLSFVPRSSEQRDRPPGCRHGRASLRIPVLGALAITSGMLLVGYIASSIHRGIPAPRLASLHRVPLGCSPCSLTSRPRTAPAAVRPRHGRGGDCAACSVAAATTATAVSSARVTAGGSALRGCVDLQRRVSDHTGHPLDDAGVGDVFAHSTTPTSCSSPARAERSSSALVSCIGHGSLSTCRRSTSLRG